MTSIRHRLLLPESVPDYQSLVYINYGFLSARQYNKVYGVVNLKPILFVMVVEDWAMGASQCIVAGPQMGNLNKLIS